MKPTETSIREIFLSLYTHVPNNEKMCSKIEPVFFSGRDGTSSNNNEWPYTGRNVASQCSPVKSEHYLILILPNLFIIRTTKHGAISLP
jgi:hypothetical protein